MTAKPGRFGKEKKNLLVIDEGSQSTAKEKTHRTLAWGVLGSASDGLPFLLTHPVVFRSM